MAKALDVVGGGFHTFYLNFGTHAHVMARQLGMQPGDQRVTLRFAVQVQQMKNPPMNARTTQLMVQRDAALESTISLETNFCSWRGFLKREFGVIYQSPFSLER